MLTYLRLLVEALPREDQDFDLTRSQVEQVAVGGASGLFIRCHGEWGL
jgi:hypothetical protein